MEEFIFDLVEYHVYQDDWKPAAGEQLHAEQDFENPVDIFAAKPLAICLVSTLKVVLLTACF